MFGGYIPYWRTEGSLEAAEKNADILDQISPFSFEVDKKGTIKNPFKRKWKLWQHFIETSRKQGNKKLFVPTIYWTETEDMHNVLSNKSLRDKHIEHIIETVENHGFDGININYERVCSHDREEYLIFLKKLSQELHKRGLVLHTSIGGRTGDNTIGVLHPNHKHTKHGHTDIKKHKQKNCKQSHISLNPGKGEAAIRYKKTLVECCDQIHFMGYDEWGRPYKHNKEYRNNKYYVSHSSKQWVEQIIQYALTFIPPHKIVLALPTYGLEFAIFHHNDDITIQKRRNLTYPKALEVAAAHHVKPSRTGGGELCYSYKTAREERYVCFVDAQTTKDKIDLVKKYGIKGIYLFTINGDVEASLWQTVRKELVLK